MKKKSLEVRLENSRGKFDLVLEGQEPLRSAIQEIRGDLSAKL
ncbi:hypothetical protein P9J64_14330 [Deltaproteobacteria bacterium IMCC39524]|nr:hypothetical protein [Deltaproteobacteria bacterium IMCC39524]